MIAVYLRKSSESFRESARLMHLPSYTQIDELIEYLKQEGVVTLDEFGRERMCREFEHRLVKIGGSARIEIIMSDPPPESQPRKPRKTRKRAAEH